ncbi:MarR family winged helix-turn-helix transcriptional regulator [Salinicoccus halitifaciens]|uniref:MarR family winged helix-turn-helix transcriptional regulator n=1 Tax=Salinicoccus halitifaciens TaxID=1073415 RepID=UPI001E40BED6|nr:MarR family transcriptional regulator [Salinicoccus halitifaciens]MCD2138065.1 MarR family transcriptional regulator [Salinicoccus halitifaciens]
MPAESIKIADQLCFSAYNLSRLFAKFYESALSKYNLTFTQYLVLSILWESEEPQTLHSIGEKLSLGSNTLTPLLRRLEDTGWVRRERLASDRRQLAVHLTEMAEKERHAISEAIADCVADDVNIEDYKAVKQVLEMLETSLEDMITKSRQ